jgi:hypothetical protein
LETIDDVQAGGVLGHRIDLTVRNNFLRIDLDQEFLRRIRTRRPKEKILGYDRFIGLGLQIHAAVQFAKLTGNVDAIARKNYLITETIKTQSPSGWIGEFTEEPSGAQLSWEFAFHEAAYIAFGLAENYRLFQHRQSLDAARKLADYIISNWPYRDKERYITTLGIVEACFSLYQLTGDPRYLRFATDEPLGRKFTIAVAPLKTWEQPLRPPQRLSEKELAALIYPAPRQSENVHMYRLFERATMQLRLDRMEPLATSPAMAQRILDGLTRQVRPAMLITGNTSYHESWHEDQAVSGPVAETCATVYELMFLDEVIRRFGDLRYGNIMERAIYNGLFGAQEPNGRKLCYFTPPSGRRETIPVDYYCCPNNFRRGIGALPRFVYYRSTDGIAVNLYTTSEARIDLGHGRRVIVRQETDYPTSGQVLFRISAPQPARFRLRLRIPLWVGGASIQLNDGRENPIMAGSLYHDVFRTWSTGDRIVLRLRIENRFVRGKEKQSGKFALLRGPVVYGISRERSSINEGVTLRDITVDPKSIAQPIEDGRARPGGTAIHARAWSPGRELKGPTDLELILTEFIDPSSEEVYFNLPDGSTAKEDELYWTKASGN